MCYFPFMVGNPLYPLRSREPQVPAPCGKCPPCLHKKSQNWIIRLMNHEKITTSAQFITLTYAPEYVPISKKGFMSLRMKDYTKFMKALRYQYSYRKINPETGRMKRYYDKVPDIKYYAVGEYGSETYRPHYHAIIFNADIDKIEKAWKKGHVYIGTVTSDSVAYVTKYIHKGKLIPVHKNDDREPEKANMSKGLGLNYLTPQQIAFHRQDLKMAYINQNGYKKSMPRYYKEKIWNETERQDQSVIMQGIIAEKTKLDQQSHQMRTGRPKDYWRDKKQAEKADYINFKKKENEKRKKI